MWNYFLLGPLSSNPHELASIIAADPADIIVIDDIQRIPELLNEIQRRIESQNLTFLLTGSSARKLRRGKANLLAGRVWHSRMFPLIYREIPDFKVQKRFLKPDQFHSSLNVLIFHEFLQAYDGNQSGVFEGNPLPIFF